MDVSNCNIVSSLMEFLQRWLKVFVKNQHTRKVNYCILWIGIGQNRYDSGTLKSAKIWFSKSIYNVKSNKNYLNLSDNTFHLKTKRILFYFIDISYIFNFFERLYFLKSCPIFLLPDITSIKNRLSFPSNFFLIKPNNCC